MTAKPILVIALLAVSTPFPAQAGFFFEGLEPFSTRACDPVDRRYQDPEILPPGSGVIVGSPSRYNTGGTPPFRALPCASPRPGKAAPASPSGGGNWWRTK